LTERDVVAVSKDLDRTIEVVVCIPSFRRPDHLRLTLQSLAQQDGDVRFAVVIVENDAAVRGSVAVASEFLQRGDLRGLCVVEPAQGNCHAINAAYDTALATFPDARMLLMIDDDEIATPGWLAAMVEAARISRADVVGGPVFPQFEDADRRGLSQHPAFRPAYDRTGPVPVVYGSGNCLITRAVFDRLPNPRFDVRFNFLGGGDADFFARCRRAGFRSYWVQEAVITETVPPSRTETRWLALRGLRIGAINYRVELIAARTSMARLRLVAKNLALLPVSVLRAGRILLADRRPILALHPLAVAAGRSLAAVGIEPQPYKAKSPKGQNSQA
jgi:GT2 family glycosyltransferase